MSKSRKRILLLIMLSVLVLAAVLLIYGLMPIEGVKEIFPITPTYLTPPGGLP